MKKIILPLLIFASSFILLTGCLNSPGITTGVFGSVYGVNDVGFPTPYPLTNYSVVAVPETNYDSWLSSLEVYRQRSGIVDAREAKQENLGLPNVFAKTDAGGNYRLELLPGTYILCFLKESASKDGYIVGGCTKLSIASGETIKVDYSMTVGGIGILCPENRCQEVIDETTALCRDIYEKCYASDCHRIDSSKINQEICVKCFSEGANYSYVAECFGLIAIKLNDRAVCEELTDERQKASCNARFSNFIFSNATGTASCEEILDEAFRKTCLDQLQNNT